MRKSWFRGWRREKPGIRNSEKHFNVIYLLWKCQNETNKIKKPPQSWHQSWQCLTNCRKKKGYVLLFTVSPFTPSAPLNLYGIPWCTQILSKGFWYKKDIIYIMKSTMVFWTLNIRPLGIPSYINRGPHHFWTFQITEKRDESSQHRSVNIISLRINITKNKKASQAR